MVSRHGMSEEEASVSAYLRAVPKCVLCTLRGVSQPRPQALPSFSTLHAEKWESLGAEIT